MNYVWTFELFWVIKTSYVFLEPIVSYSFWYMKNWLLSNHLWYLQDCEGTLLHWSENKINSQVFTMNFLCLFPSEEKKKFSVSLRLNNFPSPQHVGKLSPCYFKFSNQCLLDSISMFLNLDDNVNLEGGGNVMTWVLNKLFEFRYMIE